jgi:hypothetical protein
MQLFTNTYRSVSNLSVLSVFVLFFANKCVSVVHTSPTRNRKSPSLSSIWVKVVLSSREIRTYQFEEDKKTFSTNRNFCSDRGLVCSLLRKLLFSLFDVKAPTKYCQFRGSCWKPWTTKNSKNLGHHFEVFISNFNQSTFVNSKFFPSRVRLISQGRIWLKLQTLAWAI